MTTPYRMPLSERMEALRVADGAPPQHTLTIPSPDDRIPAGVIFNTTTLLDNTTNVALAREGILSPIVSPDEFVIRQRGRRRLTTTWSPEQTTGGVATTSPFQRTPTKMLTTSMILRSSPRKRLTMGTIQPSSPDLAPPVTPSPNKRCGSKELFGLLSPIVKRLRLGDEDRPLAQLNADIPLPVVLQGMSKRQLIEVISAQLNQCVGTVDSAEERLRAQLPLPDIAPLEEELLHAKRNIFKSLPTSRLCKKTDSSAFSRAAPLLAEFKRLLNAHTKLLYDSAHWDALLDYVTLAWPCVSATPYWDAHSHNTIRRQCFKLLCCHCIAGLKNGGMLLGTGRLQRLERHMSIWLRDYEDVICCINTLNRTLSRTRNSL